jgi:hypothetical protein
MKYELMYWHAFFVRRGLYSRATVAMFLMKEGRFTTNKSESYSKLWRMTYATPIN